MNNKKIAIIILSIFIIGMCIGAVDAAHTVQKGKNKVKLTNKEYKKLTAEKTQYKTVTKTRNVTKYKNVTKTRTVQKENTTIKEGVVNSTYYYNSEYKMRAVNKTAEVINLENEGYNRTGDVWTVKYSPPLHLDEPEYGYNESVGYVKFTQKESDDFQNFSKTTYYNVTEKYTVKEPYKVTEKYKVKVPYKVRKDATITKRVPKKFDYYKEAIPVYKKFKVAYTVKKWKYLGKSAIFGIQSPKERQYTKNKAKKLKAKGWKINKNKHKSKYDFIEGSYKHYYLCSKKCYRTEKRIVKYKYKKVKTPLMMTISSYKGLKKGKVFCELWSEVGIISAGNGKIK